MAKYIKVGHFRPLWSIFLKIPNYSPQAIDVIDKQHVFPVGYFRPSLPLKNSLTRVIFAPYGGSFSPQPFNFFDRFKRDLTSNL